jgi:hypothetical protein
MIRLSINFSFIFDDAYIDNSHALRGCALVLHQLAAHTPIPDLHIIRHRVQHQSNCPHHLHVSALLSVPLAEHVQLVCERHHLQLHESTLQGIFLQILFALFFFVENFNYCYFDL